jgi:hypothetical protein
MLDTPRGKHIILLSALQSRSLPITPNKLRHFQTRGVNIQWNFSSAVSLSATLYTNGSTEGLYTESTARDAVDFRVNNPDGGGQCWHTLAAAV